MRARVPKGAGNNAQNMNQMIRQAQKMQDQITELQDDIEARDFPVTVGGGVVELVMTGKKTIKSLTIKPEVVDPIVLSEGPYTDAGCHNEKSTANASFP